MLLHLQPGGAACGGRGGRTSGGEGEEVATGGGVAVAGGASEGAAGAGMAAGLVTGEEVAAGEGGAIRGGSSQRGPQSAQSVPNAHTTSTSASAPLPPSWQTPLDTVMW